MHCFPCFSTPKTKKSSTRNETNDNEAIPHERRRSDEAEQLEVTTFTFRELAIATKNFRQECLLGEGGFGRVYKGTLQSTGQVVAIKQLDKHGLHGNKEFQAEVLLLGQLDHPNLVKLIGYCADGDQRLLVYEYVSGGSLEDHLQESKSYRGPMDWTTRMQIAYGAAQGLNYLHEKVNPPVIYPDLKSSNILLDDDLTPKLSDFGLHKLSDFGPGPDDQVVNFSSRVMGTYGYSAPEYTRGGNLSMKSDIFSFGITLLELITGRRALDTTRPNNEQNLVCWALPVFRDPKRYHEIADPVLEKKFPERGLKQAVAIAAMCVQEEATARPLISDIMVALSFLSMSKDDGIPTEAPILSFRDKSMSIALSRHDSELVSPPPELSMENDKPSTSSDEESSLNRVKETMSKKKKKKKKHTKKDSSIEYDDGSDSSSDDEHEKDRKSPPPKTVNEENPAQSLKMKYRYSWEEVEVGDERLSSKSSRNSNDESLSSHYDSDIDHDDSPRKEEKEEVEEHTHFEHIHSSKTDDDQTVYFDDDNDDGESGDDNEASLHRIKSEVDVD